jgi:cytoskeletal protein RodZ
VQADLKELGRLAKQVKRPAFRVCLERGPPLSSIAKAPVNGHKRADMPTVAEYLRNARESQNLTIHQIAETTKIRTDHIRALEAGDFNVFTAPVYIRGFVRCYATLLKLDVPQVMATLDTELRQTEKFSEPPALSSGRRGALDFVMLQLSKVNWQKGLVLLIGVVIVVIFLVVIWVWQKHKTSNPLSGLPPAVYQPTQHQSGETLPLPAPPPRKQ